MGRNPDYLDVVANVARDDSSRSDHRRRPHVDVIEDDRPHAQVGPGADRARAGDVRSRLNRDELSNLRVVADQRSAVHEDVSIELQYAPTTTPALTIEPSPTSVVRDTRAVGWMMVAKRSPSARPDRRSSRDASSQARTLQRGPRLALHLVDPVHGQPGKLPAAALRLHVLHESSDAQAGDVACEVSDLERERPRAENEAKRPAPGYQPLRMTSDHLTHLLVGEGDVHGQRDRPAPERLDVRRGGVGNIGYR